MPIMDGTPYDTNKRYRKAVEDENLQNPETVTPIAVAVPKAKRKAKVIKYLVWGLAIVGIYLLWKKYAKK